MHFVAHKKVIIGNKELQTVIKIKADNNGQNIGAECTLVVPLNCRIQYQDGKHDFLTDIPKNLFKVGDPITITAWYETYATVTVFKGFVYDFMEGNPTEIKCLDYIYFFNQGVFGNKRIFLKKSKKSKKGTYTTGNSFKQITLKNLLQNLVDFVNDTIDDQTDGVDHVVLAPDILDFNLVNITFAMMSPAAILQWFKKELMINISLNGNQLYVNLASNKVKTVILRTDRNVIKSKLQKPEAAFQTFQLKATFLNNDGTKSSFSIGDTNGILHEVSFKTLSHDTALFQKLATEALLNMQLRHYGGMIETLLYPECDIFWDVDYTDIRYPDRTGRYVITSHSFELDEKGYHRHLRLAYLVQPLPNQLSL